MLARISGAALVAVAALALAGCSGGTGDSGSTAAAATGGGVDGEPVVTHASDPQPGGKPITKAALGKKWPLSIDRGILHCEGSKVTGAVTLYVDGVTYALNLPAAGQGRAGASPIWLDDKANAGMKLPMGPLVQEGLKLCR